MSGSWVRLWHEMPTDPKWRVVARVSGQRIGDVIAVFTMLMVEGSRSESRGDISRFRAEDAAAALDMDDTAVEAILSALEGRAVTEGFLNGWDKRQPKREDDSKERVAKHRQATKSAEISQNSDVTQRNAPDTDTDTDTDKKKEEIAAQRFKPAAPDLPISEAVDAWNETAAVAGWPGVKRLSDPRRSAIRSRLRDEGLDGWKAAIAKARASALLGHDPPAWFTFDFITKPTNFLKLIEGNYDNRKPNFGSTQRTDESVALTAASRAIAFVEQRDRERSGAGASGDVGTRDVDLLGYG